MGGRPLSRRELALATGFVLASVVAIIAAWVSFGGSLPFATQGYRVTIAFPNAPTLVTGSDVRIAGVPVGKVVAVRAGEASTEATIELNQRFVPLPRDARAIVRIKTPLGESYIELTPGTRGSPTIPDGGRLPVRNVAAAQQIEDLLSTFDAPTRRAFEQVMLDTSASLNRNGANLNAALGASAPASADINVLLQALNAQGSDVQTLVSRSAQALRAISARPGQLQRLIGAGDTVMSTTARRATAVTATVRALAPFVTELTKTDAPLTRTANLATPTLRTLAPVTPLMLPALTSVQQLAPQLRHSFRSLAPALRRARADLGPAATLVGTVPALGTALDAAGRQLVPLVELVQAYDRDAVDSLASFGSVLEPTKRTAGSAFSRYARTAIVLTSEGNLGYAKREPWNRYNPYPPPGALGDGRSLGCANTSNPQTTPEAGAQVPCAVEPPWSFRGAKRSFPLLTRYAPEALPRR